MSMKDHQHVTVNTSRMLNIRVPVVLHTLHLYDQFGRMLVTVFRKRKLDIMTHYHL